MLIFFVPILAAGARSAHHDRAAQRALDAGRSAREGAQTLELLGAAEGERSRKGVAVAKQGAGGGPVEGLGGGARSVADPALAQLMQPTTTTTTRDRSVSEELSDSFVGAVLGWFLFFVGFPIVYFNEQRQVKMWGVFSHAADICVTDVAPSTVEDSNEACLVHVKGTSTGELLEDAQFGMQMKDSAKLRREVEMYQWVETSATRNEGQKQVTETKYAQQWRSELVDSSKFKQQQKKNPPSFPIAPVLRTAKVKLGAFDLPGSLVERMSNWTKCTQCAKKEVTVAGLRFELDGDSLVSGNPDKPQIGDLRVRFQYVPCGDCTVMAVQHERSFVALRYGMRVEGGKVLLRSGEMRDRDEEAGGKSDCDVCCCGLVGAAVESNMELYELQEAALSADEVLDRARAAQATVHTVLLVLGWFCLVVGLKLMLDLVPAAISAPFGLIYGVGFSLKDFLATVGGFFIWLLAILVGSALFALTYAVAWLVARPLKGIMLILLSGALFYLPSLLTPK